MSVIILDIDNTIANDLHRVPLIDHANPCPIERYHAYHAAGEHDEVGNHHLFRGVPHDIAIFTARPNMYRRMTAHWLLRAGVNFRWLMMRQDGDLTPSPELKRQQLRNFIQSIPITDIVAAYDDRHDVIAMFRAEGIQAHHIQINEVNYACPRKS